MALHLNKFEFCFKYPNTFSRVWCKLALWFRKKKMFKNHQWIFTESLLSPFGNIGVTLHLDKLESPSHKNDLCQVEIGPVVMMMILKGLQCIFTLLLLFSHGKRHGPSFEQTWIPFNQMRLSFAKLTKNVGLISWRGRKFQMSYQCTNWQHKLVKKNNTINEEKF